jgi:hypothetical protein
MSADLFDVEQIPERSGDEAKPISLLSTVAVKLHFAQWFGGDPDKQGTLWKVRVDDVGLIAVIAMPERTATRYKDPVWAKLLPDEYLIARLVLNMPKLVRKS